MQYGDRSGTLAGCSCLLYARRIQLFQSQTRSDTRDRTRTTLSLEKAPKT